jgi:hypothetical protein
MYPLLICPSSDVRLTKLRRKNCPIEFGIVTRRTIAKNTIIYPLVGMMASDTNLQDHTELSVMSQKHRVQTGPKGARIMTGPARLVNHVCRRYNAEVSYENN